MNNRARGPRGNRQNNQHGRPNSGHRDSRQNSPGDDEFHDANSEGESGTEHEKEPNHEHNGGGNTHSDPLQGRKRGKIPRPDSEKEDDAAPNERDPEPRGGDNESEGDTPEESFDEDISQNPQKTVEKIEILCKVIGISIKTTQTRVKKPKSSGGEDDDNEDVDGEPSAEFVRLVKSAMDDVDDGIEQIINLNEGASPEECQKNILDNSGDPEASDKFEAVKAALSSIGARVTAGLRILALVGTIALVGVGPVLAVAPMHLVAKDIATCIYGQFEDPQKFKGISKPDQKPAPGALETQSARQLKDLLKLDENDAVIESVITVTMLQTYSQFKLVAATKTTIDANNDDGEV
ncbi:hypothetical protein CGLO_16242 [Colletotrichum gloeosporioides Cg-14]|uniref:Uncharacterized protein n=1 Tax=Colletotrichum gloeosporioides (strain Cg-14) TaxID=1237896 RepID=T0JP65_COLGC|nr:hypothetical protein CGLO_16242 [Colletotrichum gloeosporioides Cg-14]